MPRKQKPLTFFADLPQEERHHIYLVLQNHTYKEVADYIYQNHGKLVSENTIARFYHRCCEDERLETLPEIRDNADAWLHYKQTGETTRFDEAALELIKLKTFELAATLRNPAEFSQLNGLSRILFAARLADVRERTTTVRERRLALDERKQQWRESMDERTCRNSNPAGTPSTSDIPGTTSPRPRVSESPRLPQEEPYDPNKPTANPPTVDELPLIDPTQMTDEEFRQHLRPTQPTDLEATNPFHVLYPIRFPTAAEWMERAEENWDKLNYSLEIRKRVLRMIGTERYAELHPVNQPPGSKYWDPVKLTGDKWVSAESTYDYPKTGKPNPCIDGTLWDRDVIAAIHARYFGPPIPPHLYWHKDKEIWSTEPLPVLSERERNPWLVRHDDDEEEEQAELSTQLEEIKPEEDYAP